MNTKQVIGASFLFIIALWIFSGLGALSFPQPIMVIMHSTLELASIIPLFVVVFIVWFGSNQDTGPRMMMLSLTALAAGLLEAAHLFTFPGMATGTEWSILSIWGLYLLFARILFSCGLLYSVCLPLNSPTTLPLRTMLYSIICLSTGLIANIALNHDIWLANYSLIFYYAPYLPLVITAISLIVLYRSLSQHGSNNLLMIALIFNIIADLGLALHTQGSYTLNLPAHLFKVMAALYLVAYCHATTIQQPYNVMMQYKDELEALAANNAKLYQESEHHRTLIEDTLAKIGVMISSQLNLKDTLESIADMVADLMGARQSIIALSHKDQSTLQVVASYGMNAPPAFIPLSDSLAGQVLEQKIPLSISDLTVHPELYRPQLIFSSIRSIISAPLVNDKEVIGIVEAYSSEKGAFNDADRLLLKALGYHGGAAVASAMLYEETKVRLDEEKFLSLIAHSAASTIETDTIISQCTGHIVQALHADVGLGILNYGQQSPAKIKASINLACREIEIDLAAYPQLIELLDAWKPVAASADIFPFINDHCETGLIKQLLIMPLSVERRLLGLIIVGWQRYVSPEYLDRPLFPALMAQQIALGLEKAQLYNQIKALALSDGLTGLANRRNFDMFLRTELRRATSLKRPLSLIMFDLDKFKNYNDTYGHLIGDKLLAQVGEILRHGVRSIDFPARYGGEEFSVILPECSNSEAMLIAETLRHTVENAHFPDNMSTHTARITASLGVATYDPALSTNLADMEMIISVADKALYQAKQQGRNKVISAAIWE